MPLPPKPNSRDYNSRSIITCPDKYPDPDKIKQKLPKYGPENAVAYFPIKYLVSENPHIPVNMTYSVLAYNSNSKSEDTIELGNLEEINRFIQGKDIIIEIREGDISDKLNGNPAAKIYKNEDGNTYIMLDLKGPGGLPDGNIDAVLCVKGLNHTLVEKTVNLIWRKRVQDKLRKDELGLLHA